MNNYFVTNGQYEAVLESSSPMQAIESFAKMLGFSTASDMNNPEECTATVIKGGKAWPIDSSKTITRI